MTIFQDHPRSRVALILPEKEHVDLLLRLVNEMETVQYLSRHLPISRKGEETWVESANNDTNVVLVIALKQGEVLTPIGTMGIHRIDWKNRRGTTGAAMLEKYCGNGYGTDAKMLLMRYAFHELGLHKLESRVLAFNGRSAAYSKKCGFRIVGKLRDQHWRKGKWHDELILDALRCNWEHLWDQFEEGTFGVKRKKRRSR